MCRITNLLPIGFNRFGEVYMWDECDPVGAFVFMLGMKSGYIRNVFWSETLGAIDLAWGTDKGRLSHIIQKHMVECNDFYTLQDLVDVVEKAIDYGELSEQGTNASFDYEHYRVSVARSDEGNWVLTAFDKSRTRKEKQRKEPGTTIGDQSVVDRKNGTLVSSDSQTQM